MSFLRIWRKFSGKTQAQMAAELGENHKTYSAYERGSSPLPPEMLSKLRGMGYTGPSNQRLGLEDRPLTREDFSNAMAEFQKAIGSLIDSKQKDMLRGMDRVLRGVLVGNTEKRVPVILPEHVQEAWLILAEAIDKSGAQFKFMDRTAFGLLAGLTAEEIACNGGSVQTRARLLAQAEKLLHTQGKPQ